MNATTGRLTRVLVVSIVAALAVAARLPSTALAYGWPVEPFDE
jgi:hypothetical protein